MKYQENLEIQVEYQEKVLRKSRNTNGIPKYKLLEKCRVSLKISKHKVPETLKKKQNKF